MLKYTVTFELPDDQDTTGLVKPDVRIEGSNLTIIHVSLEQPVAGTPFDSEVDMREVNMFNLCHGIKVIYCYRIKDLGVSYRGIMYIFNDLCSY